MSTVYCNGNQILDLKGFESISVANGLLDPRFTLLLTMASSIPLGAETSVLPTRNGGRGFLTRPHFGLFLTWLPAERSIKQPVLRPRPTFRNASALLGCSDTRGSVDALAQFDDYDGKVADFAVPSKHEDQVHLEGMQDPQVICQGDKNV